MRFLLLFFIMTFSFSFLGQKNEIDSLTKLIRKSKNDTTKVTLLNQLFDSFYGYKDDTLNSICSKSLLICESNLKKNLTKKEKYIFLREKANALNNFGFYLFDEEKVEESLKLYRQALKIRQEINDQSGISNSLNNIAYNYEFLGKTKEALSYYFKSLKIREKTNDKSGMASTLNNIALVYGSNGELEKALKFTERSVKLREQLGDKKGISTGYNNLGLIYFRMNKKEEAIKYFEKSLHLRRELKIKSLISTSLSNLAYVYSSFEMYDKSEAFYLEGLAIAKEANDFDNIAHNLMFLVRLKSKTNKLDQALKYAKTLNELVPENSENIKRRQAIYALLSEVYEKKGDFKNAMSYLKLSNAIEDSLSNDENKKAILESQIQYEYDKKASIDSIAFAKETLVKNAQLETRKKQQYYLIVIALVILIFAFVVLNRFKITKKQNKIISEQKTSVEVAHYKLEEKNKEILDSITYAKRIQSAILPQPKLVKQFLEDSFILYKPKDIVAGDFYWLEVVGDTVMFAAADCTGHGVPGAMVSVVCNNGLNRAVREYKLLQPDEILNKTRELVIEEFEKSDDEVKDGMDISLCAINSKTNKLLWAGANNPLWILRRNLENQIEIIELKPDKQPIGKYSDAKPFSLHEIQLQKDDVLYVFTDGFQDQFGGVKEKKFRIAQMRALFLSLFHKSMEEQRKIIDETFESWKGKLDQVDDVCVIGVKI
jgi:serine phosphatase RsbU (regulator of sigma subunit)/Tfp pilus assembly protein PilF